MCIMLLHVIFAVAALFSVQAITFSTPESSERFYREAPVTGDPKIYFMSAVSNVTNRYAITLVTSRIKNPSVVSKEAIFSVVLPEKAFISSFVMEINNRSYKAFVKEKIEAQKIYDTAVEKGQGAAQVKISTRNSKRFIISVNLRPEEKAAFFLTYEELLERNRDQYELVLNVYPGQPVKKFHLEINIYDSQNIKFINRPRLRRGSNINAKTYETDAKISQGKTSALITFDPDEYEQKRIAQKMETLEKKGISGQFVVTYDVEKRPEGGVILQSETFFTHYLAVLPKLITFPKYIIFILDTSASMQGNKLMQIKLAMNNILNGMTPGDKFNLVEFSSFVKVWDIVKGAVTYEEGDDAFLADYEDEDERNEKNVLPSAFEVNAKTIEKAKSILDLLEALGGTDINIALQTGLKLYAKNFRDDGHQPIILFLTDGDVTNGELNYDKIIQNVTNLNNYHIPIYALSLGNSPNREFLEKLTLKNYGKSDHIYEDTDICAQLQVFFDKISETILKNITFTYGPGVDDVTKDKFDNLNKDSELTVCGRKSKNVDFNHSPPEVTGKTPFGKWKAKPVVENVESDHLKRLWAFVRIKQLLVQRKIAEDKTEVTRKALRLALKHSFVTELTSLVVVKPNSSDKVVDLEDAIEGASSQVVRHSVEKHEDAIMEPFSSNGTSFLSVSYVPIISAYNNPFKDSCGDYYSESFDDFDVLQKLPWMRNVLYRNGTVTTPNGLIQIELNSLNPNTAECATVDKKYGFCVPLIRCAPIFYKLKTLNDFLKQSCKRDETFTGICCTAQIVPS